MKLPILLLAVAVWLAGTADLAAQAANATIRARVGSGERVYEDFRITQDDLDGIKGRKGAESVQVDPQNVIEVTWVQAPTDYKKAVQSLKSGDLGTAAQQFEASLGQAENPSYAFWLPFYANWHRGEALRRLGDLAGARDAYAAAIAAKRDHRLVPDALLAVAEVSTALGDAGAARAALNDLRGVAKNRPNLLQLADFGLARLEARKGDPAKARELLDKVLREATGNARVTSLARLEMGTVLLRQERHADAESHFNGILSDASSLPAEVFVGATNGLGDCQYAQGRYAEAMYTFSKVYAVPGFLEDASLAEQVAHALYQGGRAFRLQAGKESDAEAKKKLQTYAQRVLRRAAREFGGTSAGQQAKKELD